MSEYLSFYGGSKTRSIIRKFGFTRRIIKGIAGAAGGPKWLILAPMDKFLFGHFFKERRTPLFLAGSSAGAWRFAAASCQDVTTSLENFRQGYINQWYGLNPSKKDILMECRKVLDSFLDNHAVNEILTHPYCRLNFFTVRSRGILKRDDSLILGAGLTIAAAGNYIKRDLLKHFFKRTLFYHPITPPPFIGMKGFSGTWVPLNPENLKKALFSSGSIPMLMPGIKDIPGAPAGVYRDGGVIDYHLDIPFLKRYDNRIFLFPHYTDRIIPGWLDKHIPGRQHQASHMENVLMMCPSRKFIKMLPSGRIPDRSDFMIFRGKNRERIKQWKQVCRYSEALVQELNDVIESGRLPDLVKPFERK